MKKIKLSFIIAATGILLFSCTKDKNSPGYEYMPDMYRQSHFKAFEENPNSPTGGMMIPVDGTIAHSEDREKMINYLPYGYSDNQSGRDSATAYSKNPLVFSQKHLDEGKINYDIYCKTCHGEKGMGDGPITKVTAVLTPPAYNSDQLKNATEGQIYYATQFGKNNMGSYASQLTAYERWQVVYYVQTLQGGGSTTTPTDSTATAK